jgi:hypothetical protein
VFVTNTFHVNVFFVTFFVPYLSLNSPSRLFTAVALLSPSVYFICSHLSCLVYGARRRVWWKGDMLAAVKESQLLEFPPEANFKHQGTKKARIL